MNSIDQQQITLMLPTSKGIEVIDIRSIIRVEAISNYSKLYFCSGKTLVVAKVLSKLQEVLAAACHGEMLGELHFIRVHRTHLINKNFICQYINGNGGKVKLHNGEQIDVSKRRKNHFLQCFCAAA
ncbi:MAG: LytTR family DNA-binding domain-containing protein [Ferruginibacter sp.]|nr:LytTR family transcriptional regulator [Ferruginibacter sp.]